MAHIYKAVLRPTKLEIVMPWLRGQDWFDGDGIAEIRKVAGFRFDDPDGQVGIETLLIRAEDGPTLHVPLTYRDAPLPEASDFLIGTMEHSVLGTRFVYDALADPAYFRAIVTTAVEGATQAEEYADVDGKRVLLPPSAFVTGSGTPGSSHVNRIQFGHVTVRQEESVSIASLGDVQTAVARAPRDDLVSHDLARKIDGRASTRLQTVKGSWSEQPRPVILAAVSTWALEGG